jgi:hypothetical protein
MFAKLSSIPAAEKADIENWPAGTPSETPAGF